MLVMICKECLKNLPENDFLMKNDVCYKCVYEEKIRLLKPKKNKKPIPKCAICSKNIPKGKKRKYCSEECAEIGRIKQVDNYWTRDLRKKVPLHACEYWVKANKKSKI